MRERATGKDYALKYIKDIFSSETMARYLTRELEIMKQLTSMSQNIFTTKVHDIVLGGQPESFDSIFVVMNLGENDLHKLMAKREN